MLTQTFTAELLASVLALFGVATSPLDRWAYGTGARASRKLIAYGITILCLWTFTAVAISILGWARLLIAPEPTVAWLPAPPIFAPVLFAPIAAFFLITVMPLVQSLRGLRWRRAYGVAIRREFARIPGLLPNTAAERVAWIVVSLSAGVCEEVLYRGFLIRFLHEGGLALPIAAALAISSLLFGLGHVYQGSKGVLWAIIAGFAFGLLFLLSGSLFPCIVLHALMDLQIAYVLRPIPEVQLLAEPT